MSETYLVPATDSYMVTTQKWASQSFTPKHDHILHYVDLDLLSPWPQPTPRVQIYKATAGHFPTGAPLSRSVSFNPKIWISWRKDRVRFMMTECPLQKDIERCIVLMGTGPFILSQVNWFYIPNEGAYQRGIRSWWDDVAKYWVTCPNDDHIFAEFGDPPSPPPPPDPPIDNFMILTVGQINTQEGFKFIVVTNVPCHLYMLWTNHEPWTHVVPGIRRGIAMVKEVQYCFVDWISNQQLEPGDTMVHTFVKEPWAICETRWFTFRAKVNELWSPSVGPIFKKHRIAPLPGEEHLFPLLERSNSYRSNWHYTDNEWDEIWGAGESGMQHLLGIEARVGITAAYTWGANLRRQAMAFDTTELPPGAHIISAKIAFRHIWTIDKTFPFTVQLQSIAEPYPTDPCLNAGWYQGNYDGNAGEHTFTEMRGTDTLVEISLTPFGIAQLNPGGITRFGLRVDKDIQGEECRYYRGWSYRGFFQDKQPKLYITYSPPT